MRQQTDSHAAKRGFADVGSRPDPGSFRSKAIQLVRSGCGNCARATLVTDSARDLHIGDGILRVVIRRIVTSPISLSNMHSLFITIRDDDEPQASALATPGQCPPHF